MGIAGSGPPPETLGRDMLLSGPAGMRICWGIGTVTGTGTWRLSVSVHNAKAEQFCFEAKERKGNDTKDKDMYTDARLKFGKVQVNWSRGPIGQRGRGPFFIFRMFGQDR